MSAIFSFENGAAKKTQIFHIFKRLLFRFPKFSQSNINVNVGQNSSVLKKQTGCFSAFHLDVTCRTLYDFGQSRFNAKPFKCT